MHHRCAAVGKAVDLARGQVDGVAKDGAIAHQPVFLVGVQIIAGVGYKVLDPSNLVDLFAQVRLHQAVGALRPERTQGRELFRRRGRRETGRYRIAGAAFAVPAVDQHLAVVIGRLRRIAQPVGGVAVHAGLARHDPLTTLCRRVEYRVDAGGGDGGERADGGRAVGQSQIQIAPGDVAGIGGV